MLFADRGRAMEAFSRLPLTVSNGKLAEYWLSLWSGNRLPQRSQLSPARIKELLPGIGIFEVRAGESSRCRLAGTAIQRALGREISGCDWRSYTPDSQQAERLHRNTAIARGAVGIGIRNGRAGITQELMLPFADDTEDGARLILFHLDWRPEDTLNNGKTVLAVPVADQFHTVPLIAAR
ncbi:MAG TPA: PAS domain-containing protein [Rhizomicrobium sp.]|nr:PAS domain-containing protein [Rhizomicrobium sp.]